jgi:predicted MPP superfamily phosphohydrolase
MGANRISRRRFISLSLSIAATAAVFEFGFTHRRIKATETDVEIVDLPEIFDGFKIVQLSDFHRSRWIGENHIREAGDIARSLEPDMVVFTGDMVTGSAGQIWSCLDAIGYIPSPWGTFGVLGNHDWWSGERVIRDALETVGVTVLSNTSIRIGSRGSHIWLLGVEDLWSRRASLAAANSGVDDNAPRILLCHNPDILPSAARRNMDLVISGHTHGGQVCIPGVGPLMLPIQGSRKLASGLHNYGKTQIYVSRGIGMVSPPVRICCPPEVNLIRLQRRERIRTA